VLSGDSMSYNGSSRQVLEPLFQDTPFDRSEWRSLYDILRQVNQPKAELMRVQYEAVRTAYQHYVAARAEEQNAYAVQRAADEAYNRAVAEQRRAVEAQMREVRERWHSVLAQLRTERERARTEAYLRAGEAGINLRGGALLGIGLDTDSLSAPDMPQAPAHTPFAQPPTPTTHLPNIHTAAPLRVETPAGHRTGQPAWSPLPTREEPLSSEEAAHETHLPTAQPRTAFRWIHWLAPIAVGLLLGHLLLAAFGGRLDDWRNPLLWIAMLASALSMVVWYRALWNASRALSELYYLFNWGAAQARRVAWLAGTALLVVLLLPLIAPLSALVLAPSIWSAPSLLLALLTLGLMVPLAGLALLGGYFHGRQEIVANAIQARVQAARRVRTREVIDRAEGQPLPREAAPPNAQATQSAASPNGESSLQHTSNPAPNADPQERLRAAFTAIANARAAEANYQHAKQEMADELAPLHQELMRLQPRPIYPDLPPHAQERLIMLYQQWRLAYTALLDYVAEAVRDCKEGEQIARCIAAFKDALLR